MAQIPASFVSCSCGKLHLTSNVSNTTKCSCGKLVAETIANLMKENK
jgi:hypothetical protein